MKKQLLWLIAFTTLESISLYMDLMHLSLIVVFDLLISIAVIFKWWQYFQALEEMKMDAEYHKCVARLLEDQLKEYNRMFEDAWEDKDMSDPINRGSMADGNFEYPGAPTS